MKYDFIVVGGGIAGIAVAELLQRSGRRVLLLEERNKLGSCSTAEQQGWFHTGALYAALPTNEYFKILVKNLDNLRKYYSYFSAMNFRKKGFVDSSDSETWFNNKVNYFFYASLFDNKMPFYLKMIWPMAVLRAKTRLAWMETIDISKEIGSQVNLINFSFDFSKINVQRDFVEGLRSSSNAIKSIDRTMNSRKIILDLVKSFLTHGGQIELNTKVSAVRNRCVVDARGDLYEAEHIIFAVGKGGAEFDQLHAKIKVVKSPLLVVAPSVSEINFVKVHPVISETINHLCHFTPYGDYSLVGNASYYGHGAILDHKLVQIKMINEIENVLRVKIPIEKTALYFGYKTELTGKKQLRNYQYHIVDIGNSAVFVFPGKMTLSFSLAVEVCNYFKVEPKSTGMELKAELNLPEISEPLHFEKYLEII